MRKTSKLLRCALAVTLTCGLMIPTTALAAGDGEENTPTPPLVAEIDSSPDGTSSDGIFDGPVSDASMGDDVEASPDTTDTGDESGIEGANDGDASTETSAPDTVGDAKQDVGFADGVIQVTEQGLQHAANALAAAPDESSPEAAPASLTEWDTPASCDFQILGGVADTDYSFDGSIVHIKSSTPLTLKMAAGKTITAQTIQIDAGVKADLTLAGVNISSTLSAPINMITNSDEDGDGVKVTDAADIVNKTTLYLTLADGTTNTLVNTTSNAGYPGVRCGWGSVLVIDDTMANVRSGGSKFNLNDIVTPVGGMVGEDVTLLGGKQLKAGDALVELEVDSPGKLVATGGGHCSGIGSGPAENAGTIIINGGDITASGYSGSGDSPTNGAGIGGGAGGSGTVITFNGGHVVAQAAYCGSGVGAGLGYALSTGHGKYPCKADAIAISRGAANSHGYSYIAIPSSETWLCCRGQGNCPAGVHNLQFYTSENYFTVAGDITLNGGLVDARNGGHGNAFGQSCAHGPASNRNHIIRVTGGTLLTTVSNLNSTNPPLCSVGAAFGYTIVTGGSVQVQTRANGTAAFQGIGGTAYNTTGIENWSDVEALGGSLPDGDKVQMLTIDLSSEFDAGASNADKTVPVVKWKLEVDNIEQEYGAPSYLDKGLLYLWLPESATGKNVTVTMSYRDAQGGIHDIEPMYVEEVGGDQGSTLKRYIDIDVDKLNDEQKKYFAGLEKDYDGTPFAPLAITPDKPIVFQSEQGNTYTLSDASAVTTSFQPYDEVGGSPLPGSSVTAGTKMPADTGTFRVQLVSKQYVNDPVFANNYWGHRITAWAKINPVPAVLKIHEKDGTAWVRLADDGKSYDLVKETDTEPGNRLRVAFDIRSARGTATTCKAPTGEFQVLIDGQPVGDAVPLTEDAIEKSLGSSIDVVAGDEGRETTRVVYYLDPTRLDGALDVLETTGQGNVHEVTVKYIPDKNYVEGTESSPDEEKTEATKPTTIVPVKPSGDVEPDEEDKDKGVIVGDTPEDERPATPGAPNDPSNPGDPPNPGTTPAVGTVVYKTITASYAAFHDKDNAEIADFFRLDMQSNSAAPFSDPVVSNPAVADLVRDENGKPILDENGKLQIRVDSCGTTVITVTQKPNALYSGVTYILTVNITPDPSIRPKIQIRLTWRNLTALGETRPQQVAAFAIQAIAAFAAGDEPAAAAQAIERAAVDRANTPPRPGDVLEYTVTGLNLTPGSAWQAAELKDMIDQKLSFDARSVEIAPNYATHSDQYGLSTPAFYQDFDWNGLSWASVDGKDFTWSAPTLTKGIGTVYGGQSTSVRFQATVGEDQGLGDRPEDGKTPEIVNEPSGGGSFGKPENQPGDTTTPTPLDPNSDIEVIGNGEPDPETGELPGPEPTPVLPKDPAPADIVTTVKVDIKDHREEHDDDRVLVGDTLQVTVTSTNRGPDSKLANAVVKATLPVGMEPKAGTIKLVDGEGNTYDVPDSAYDPLTGIVAVNAGDLYGDESAQLTFDVEVVSTSETRLPGGEDGASKPGSNDPGDPDDPENPGNRPEGPEITGGTLGETPTNEWELDHPTDPDGTDPSDPAPKPTPGTPFEPTKPWNELEEEFITTPPSNDPDMPPVLPASPSTEDKDGAEADIKVTKTAANTSREGDETRVGDIVRYTVTLSNSGLHTMWYDAVIRDEVPKGLEPLSGTIRLTGPDGTEREVPDSAYDSATRVLAVTAGDLVGGRSATLVFDCEVTADAIGSDIGNVASAHGTPPTGVDPGQVSGGAARPTPGEPFTPPEGWDAFLREYPGVSNADAPAYAPGTDAKGGVLAADANDKGDEREKGDKKDPIKLAQTGDDLATKLAALAMAAIVSGSVAVVLITRRRTDRMRIR